MVDGQLAGVTVLDLSSVGPGSRCTATLADLGADVIKVARPPGRGGIEPPWYSYGAGRGTRVVRLDLKSEQGRAAFLDLATEADVIVESYRPGVADRLGIGYADVAKNNARIVYAALSGYGQDGPYAKWAGHDINYLAVGGFFATQGRRADGGPAIPGATVADSAGGGMQAVIAILAALLRRATTGEGQYLDVSATEGVLSLMSLHVDEYLATGAEPAAGSTLLTGRYACYDLYEAADGGWLAVGAIEAAFFANLCRALGCEQLADAQFDDDRQDEIRSAFRAAFAQRSRNEWVDALAAADTCVAPVQSIAEVAADPHLRLRGAFSCVRHPDHGEVEQVGPVIAGSRKQLQPYTAGPEEMSP
jgi:alpha-methylacyl-CoA racemase